MKLISGAVVCATTAALLAVLQPVPAPSPATAAGPQARPDIVFILMDDFSTELLATMPEAQRMLTQGASYPNSFVVDSLCCPSRTSTFTGQPPHQTGVLTNTPNDPDHPIGGFPAFTAYGNEQRSFNVALEASGYTTGFVGKFLNLYETTTVDGVVQPPPRVPGWTEPLMLLGGGYNGWGYKSTFLDDAGQVRLEGHPRPPRTAPAEVKDAAYATNVTADKAVDFIERHSEDDAPYFLEVATYGPHSSLASAYPGDPNFPPAFADRPSATNPSGNCGAVDCLDLGTDDLVGYADPRDDNAPTYLLPDGTTAPAPAWRTNVPGLTDEQAVNKLRNRARMVQSIDRLIARVRAAAGPDAYIVLTADNGFHLGQHQLDGGKGSPYDSDSRVPLVVVGPDVVPGQREQFVNNIDLAPTFEELAGLGSPDYRSGRSIAQTLRHPETGASRYSFFEHTYAKSAPGLVDADAASGGSIEIIPSFIAVRGAEGLLVRFDLDQTWQGTDFAWELYRYDVPWEDRNVFAEDHTQPWAVDLMRRLEMWEGCEPAICRAATR